MPIAFNCTCGKTLRVPDESAGRRAKCPACGAVVQVPAPEQEPEFEVVEEPPPRPGAARHGEIPRAKPVEEEDDGGTYGLADEPRSRNDDDSDGGEDPRPSKNKLPNFRKGREKHS